MPLTNAAPTGDPPDDLDELGNGRVLREGTGVT
jgi:hypothetical protein